MVTGIKHESKVERRMPPSLAVGFPLPPWPQRLNLLALKFRLMLCGCLGLTTWSPAEPLNFVATNLWTAEVGYYNQSSPAQDTNGVLYVTAWSGWLYAVNPDGTRHWMQKIGADSVSSPAIGADGTVYFGCRDRRLHAVDRNGREKWAFQTDGWVDASAAIGSDGTIYFGSADRKFYALTPDGRKKWEFATGGQIISSAAIDADGVIYFGSLDRKFYALNPEGSKRWEFTAGGGIISSPAIGAEGTIYFTALDGDLRALNPDGSLRWKFHTGSTTAAGPVIGMTGEIFITGNSHCFSLNADGTLDWRWPIAHDNSEPLAQAGCTVLANGNIIIVPGGGLMFELSAGTNWVWNYSLKGRSSSSPVIGPEGTVFGLGFHSDLQAIQRDVPLAKSPWPMFRGNPQRTGRVTVGN